VQDPYLIAGYLTNGTYSFGEPVGNKEHNGNILLGVGISMMAIFLFVFIGMIVASKFDKNRRGYTKTSEFVLDENSSPFSIEE